MDFVALPKLEVSPPPVSSAFPEITPLPLACVHLAGTSTQCHRPSATLLLRLLDAVAHTGLRNIRRECLHEVWLRKKSRGETTVEDPLLTMPPGKCDYNLDTFFPLFSRYIYKLCDDEESLLYTTQSVLEDFAADGVVYLELRTTPRAIPSAHITKDDYVRTILSCTTAPRAPMTSRLLLSIDRRNDAATALEVVSLALKYRPRGVVGIDLCGDPALGDVSRFRPAFERARQAKLPITIHFAEAPSCTPEELWCLLDYQPQRIGHVIHVPDDVKEEIVRRKLGLELCLSGNVHGKMITGTYGDHHFGWWRGTGCPIALSREQQTDDVGVFGSRLSNEYALVTEHFGLSRTEVCDLARSAVDTIFGGDEEKARLRGLMWR
ncbi:hypothetical protein B2J93_6751 [Marssonina coronariae]|uniref:Adenosine deaminase domain-containing protein n=1 Tax=Diplocarpon coronariae TaxID=2795749 RepID=A0A218ZGG2_9HELO|nr:hypothetical protein B2J93_6751 [Marssonina coronariae]